MTACLHTCLTHCHLCYLPAPSTTLHCLHHCLPHTLPATCLPLGLLPASCSVRATSTCCLYHFYLHMPGFTLGLPPLLPQPLRRVHSTCRLLPQGTGPLPGLSLHLPPYHLPARARLTSSHCLPGLCLGRTQGRTAYHCCTLLSCHGLPAGSPACLPAQGRATRTPSTLTKYPATSCASLACTQRTSSPACCRLDLPPAYLLPACPRAYRTTCYL